MRKMKTSKEKGKKENRMQEGLRQKRIMRKVGRPTYLPLQVCRLVRSGSWQHPRVTKTGPE